MSQPLFHTKTVSHREEWHCKWRILVKKIYFTSIFQVYEFTNMCRRTAVPLNLNSAITFVSQMCCAQSRFWALRLAGSDWEVPVSITNAGSGPVTDLGKTPISSSSLLMKVLRLCHAVLFPFPHQRTNTRESVRIPGRRIEETHGEAV